MIHRILSWGCADGSSEPTASALIGLFRQLSIFPEHADRIREEVRHLDIRDPRALAGHADHLNACINEALRLYPALPSGGNRTTKDMGMTIGDTYIPPYTTIVAPRYTISRRKYVASIGTYLKTDHTAR
jgi:cytochrome P450